MTKLGYKSDLVSDGAQGVMAVLKNKYDIVFMDLQMPNMDGVQATKQIRKKLSPENQPYIIAITANAMEGDREHCLKSGMDDYLPKPITISSVRDMLKYSLEKIRQQ